MVLVDTPRTHTSPVAHHTPTHHRGRCGFATCSIKNAPKFYKLFFRDMPYSAAEAKRKRKNEIPRKHFFPGGGTKWPCLTFYFQAEERNGPA